MYEMTPLLYLELASLLVERIGTRDFFSGSIICHDGDVECRLICTVVVRHDRSNPHRITSIMPVWWEMHTTCGAEEFDNDFSFREMLRYLD